ncbi:conserved unknown protein [Ectocarpus siliculosus]|uniref:PROP1-like PPR domain-containing protein n=1 Tax=Ectocarpus siliculosus TaxID=2880 RepID=D7FK86_ECTSI|nr:conserved unknown protein [Ectocarpus siliculosus]|eukprot:CBJ29291.1 conserved unknown protein [Ectocarpus siliculosus]
MRKAGGRLAPSRSSFNICLNACRHGRQRDKVMSVLELMVQDGIPPSGKSYSSALQACAKDGNVPDARKMLGWMWTSPDLEGGVKGLRPTTWGYNCAMEACARSGDWGSAVELMDEMRTRGLSHDAFTYGAALEACGRTGNWQKAEAIVEQMADAYTESLEGANGSGDDDAGGGVFAHSGKKSSLSPTAVHCNALLQAYSRGKRVDKALRLLDEMLAVAPALPSSATPPPVLSAAAAAAPEENLVSTRIGKEESTADDGGEGSRDDDDNDDRSALLRWDPRLPLPRPDAVSFGTVIDGCSRARLADEAVCLLKVMGEERIGGTAPIAGGGGGGSEMWRSGGGGGSGGGSGDTPLLPPNVHCLTAAITACGRANRLELAIAVLREAAVLEDAWLDEQGRGVEADAGIAASGGRSSVNETAKFNSGKLAGGEDAEATIDGDKSATAGAVAAWDGSETSTAEGPLRARSSLQPAFNAAINACVKAGSHGEARLLMRDMGERGLRPGREAFNSLLVACSTSYEAMNILAEMERARVAPDVASYTAAIGACSRGGDLPAALGLFEAMRRPSPPGAAAAAARVVEPGTGDGGAGGRAATVRAAPMADAQAYGAAAAACARGLDHRGALRLLGEMREARLRPGRPMFGAVIDACARRGKWEEATALLEEMTASGVAPSLRHYSSAIFACALGENPGKGLELLSVMRKKRVSPNSTCVNAAIHGFALLGDWEKSLEILSNMERTYHVVPDSAGLALFDRMRSYPPNPPRSGGGGSGGGEKASAASHSTKRHPRTFLRVSLPNGGGAAAMVQPAAPAAPARQRQSARDAGADSADSVEKSGGEVVGGAVACRERAGVAGGEGISTAHPRSAVAATEGAEVSAAVGAGKGKGQGGRSAFRASSPPRPDTASYNTVIAAVASAWGWGGRGQATALLREMGFLQARCRRDWCEEKLSVRAGQWRSADRGMRGGGDIGSDGPRLLGERRLISNGHIRNTTPDCLS